MLKDNAASYPAQAAEILEKEKIILHVRWESGIDRAVISELESHGAEFIRLPSGGLLNPAGYSVVKSPWELVREICEHRAFDHIDCGWFPKLVEPLDVSAPEVGATLCWETTAGDGYPLTGSGAVVANFDTGIDVFHPDFFRPDGGAFVYLDVDHSGRLTPGIDAVDLNSNGAPDFGEELTFFESYVGDAAGAHGGSDGVSNLDGIYQPDWDYLYLDENFNGKRDFGSDAGFNDFDPGFGEPLFILAPAAAPTLDDGDTLLMLGSSKIAAAYFDSITYQRDMNIVHVAADMGSHGTGVSSIIAGGFPGSRKFTGIAPEADLLAVYRYTVDYILGMDWAATRSASVFLWEMGGWVWYYMDGSSAVEQSINEYSALGISQVTPAGNLNGSAKHSHFFVAPYEIDTVRFNFPEDHDLTTIWGSFIWREMDTTNLHFVLHEPGGVADTFRTGHGSLRCGGEYGTVIDYSSRETGGFFFYFWDIPDTSAFYFEIANSSCCLAAEMHGYISDDISSWGGGTIFDSEIAEEDFTVTWPATADSGICVASYSPRGYGNYINSDSSAYVGMLSRFSGRGYRVSDYIPLVDIAAPGNYDVWASHSSSWSDEYYGGYQQFGGTSAAGPHVAGAIALINQQYPSWTQGQIVELLTSTTRRDTITGFTYNTRWGNGRLDIGAALTTIEEGSTRFPAKTVILSATPNPFNATVAIKSSNPVLVIELFDILGRRVDILASKSPRYNFFWTPLVMPSGIYFARATGFQTSCRIVFLK